jgi:hypothetical protein
MNLFDFDKSVAAAAIAATGTVIGALIQLRVAWRKELSERARSVPVSKKSRRGPVVAVGLLLLAAGVGGFALSWYLTARWNRESLALRDVLEAQVAQINATATRLERATLGDQGSMEHAAADGETTVTPADDNDWAVPRARWPRPPIRHLNALSSEALRVTLREFARTGGGGRSSICMRGPKMHHSPGPRAPSRLARTSVSALRR